MWCWHRIRESESGLCPACRTPYGDDPHEFSAVDVEEVLKANKEKEAAAKKERDRQRQHSTQQQPTDGNSSDGEGVGTFIGQMEVPKDRMQLANMRVIRRNLVYAVGLPPSIASEEILKKPEYFGQYGKIAKIVLNRSQTAGGDVRRASASAYVTFAHKVSDTNVALGWVHCETPRSHLVLVVRRILCLAFWLWTDFIWKGEISGHLMVPQSIAPHLSKTFVAIIQNVHTCIKWETSKTHLQSKRFKLDM